jgi:hypothetical protein
MSGHGGAADALIFPFPRSGEPVKGLRELREERGWSQSQTVRAIYACAAGEEKKGLPGPDSLLANWKRWEAGKTEPDGGRSEPFYKPIIARIFGTVPEKIFPSWTGSQGRVFRPVSPGDLRDELESRRRAVQQAISQLQQAISQHQAEFDYLTAVLMVPVPGTAG